MGLEADQVVFTWRDRAAGDRSRTMRLHAHEFLRRFLLHVLPDGFMRIRSYGLLANRNRSRNVAHCRELLGVPDELSHQIVAWTELLSRLTGTDPTRCPECGNGLLTVVEIPAQGRAPPEVRRTS